METNTLPLSREEMATYISYINEATRSDVELLSSALKSIVAANEERNEALINSINALILKQDTTNKLLKDIYESTSINKNSKNKVVTALYEKYAKNNHTTIKSAEKYMVAKLKARVGDNLVEERKQYAQKNGRKNCSFAHYVSNTPHLLKMLAAISEEKEYA